MFTIFRSRSLVRLLVPLFVVVVAATYLISAAVYDRSEQQEAQSGRSFLRQIDAFGSPDSGSSLDEPTLASLRALPEVESVEGVITSSIHAGPDGPATDSYVLTAVSYRSNNPPPVTATVPGSDLDRLQILGPGEVLVPEETQGTNFLELLGDEISVGYIELLAPGEGVAKPDTVRVVGTYESDYEADGFAVAYASTETIEPWWFATAVGAAGTQDGLSEDSVIQFQSATVTAVSEADVAVVADTMRGMGLEITVLKERTGDIGGLISVLELTFYLVAGLLFLLLVLLMVQISKVASSELAPDLALLLVSGNGLRHTSSRLRQATVGPLGIATLIGALCGGLAAYATWPDRGGGSRLLASLAVTILVTVISLASSLIVVRRAAGRVVGRDLIEVLNGQ